MNKFKLKNNPPIWQVFLHQAGVVLTLFGLILAVIAIIGVCFGLVGLAVTHSYSTPNPTPNIQ